MRLVRIREGRTDLLVPKESLAVVPPTAPVFFNPAAATNRDISVAITGATGGSSFCDALAGVGSRGVRVAREVRRKMRVTLVDFNRDSVRLERRNARLNGVQRRCEFVADQANSYLYSRYGRDERFDYVDVDPFGTPIPYLQAALHTTRDGGIASFTATDTAVLCGVHPQVAKRRYMSTPLNNHFHHETALRILVNAIRRQAASLDLGIAPVAAHSTKHYVRVFVRIERGATRADEGAKSEGYLAACTQSGHLAMEQEPTVVCGVCGGKTKWAGPLWAGSLTDPGVVEQSTKFAKERGLRNAEVILASLQGVERFPPWSFSIEGVCSSLAVASVSTAVVAARLSEIGYKTMGQPFEKSGLKTDASYDKVVAAVRSAIASQKMGSGRASAKVSRLETQKP